MQIRILSNRDLKRGVLKGGSYVKVKDGAMSTDGTALVLREGARIPTENELKQDITKNMKSIPLTMGLENEFELIENDGRSYFRAGHIEGLRQQGLSGEVGLDGNNDTGEMRFAPVPEGEFHKQVYRFSQNLTTLKGYVKNQKLARPLRVEFGAGKFHATGMHVHFTFPKTLCSEPFSLGTNSIFSIDAVRKKKIIKHMDKATELVYALKGGKSSLRRSGGYEGMSLYKMQGAPAGLDRLEYRSLPSIGNKNVFTTVMAYSKLVSQITSSPTPARKRAAKLLLERLKSYVKNEVSLNETSKGEPLIIQPDQQKEIDISLTLMNERIISSQDYAQNNCLLVLKKAVDFFKDNGYDTGLGTKLANMRQIAVPTTSGSEEYNIDRKIIIVISNPSGCYFKEHALGEGGNIVSTNSIRRRSDSYKEYRNWLAGGYFFSSAAKRSRFIRALASTGSAVVMNNKTCKFIAQVRDFRTTLIESLRITPTSDSAEDG